MKGRAMEPSAAWNPELDDTFPGATRPDVQLRTPGAGLAFDAQRLARGASIGRYVILEQLGEGGMGCVYAAYDPSLDRRVALKLLKPDFVAAAPQDSRQRLRREAQAMARLNHPHVITVHDVGLAGEQIFVAMEMVKGGTLRTWLEDGRPRHEVLRAFADAAEGLLAAHGAGLVHRDFKPENVLVGHDGRVRVTDFGLARSASEAPHAAATANLSVKLPLKPLTHAGAVLGTPAYMAPEQLRGLPTDARTDQFSFAVSLYEALYGGRPFVGDSLEEIKAAIDHGRVRAPAPGSDVPSPIRRALLKALHADPNQRFESMRGLLEALAFNPSARRRRRIALGIGLLAVLGAAAGTRAVAVRERVRCEAEGSLAGVWDDSIKGSARDAFLGTGLPSAAQAFERVNARLDTAASAWSRATTELCLSRNTAPPAEVTRRTSCLQHSRDDLDATSALLRNIDRKTVEGSVIAAQRLSDPSTCLNALPKALAAQVASPTVPAELRARLARAEVHRRAGQGKLALQLLDSVVDDARKLSLKRLEAEALFRRAQTYALLLDERMEQGYLDAIWAAEAAGDDERVAEARIDNIEVLGTTLGKLDEARRAAHEAEAVLARLGDNGRLQALYALNRGDLLALEGKFDEAIVLGRHALELDTALLGPQHPDTVYAETLLANTLSNAGRYDEALAMAKHNVEATEALYGPEHRATGRALALLGIVYLFRGQAAEALPVFQRWLANDEARVGPNDSGLWFPLDNTAEALLKVGRPAESLAMYQRALRLLDAGSAHDAPALAELWAGIGRSQLALSHPAQAVPLLEKALAVREQRPGERANLAENRLALADALWASKRDKPRALALASAAREVWAQGGDGDAANVQHVDAWLAAHAR
jgi:tetratricopeptide (TPR) repeat protein